MEATTTEKRKALRKMMQGPGCHIAPSCNDGIQARLVEWLGFPLVHISGSGQHRSLGFADAGLLTLTEMIDTRRDENLIIIARSEAKDSLQERIDRVQACCEAGADAVWLSARSEDEIKAFAKIGKPLVGVPPRQLMTIERYGELGGRVGCIPTVLQVAALHGMRQCLEELKRSGTETRYFKETPGIDETRKWYSELGNKELKELESKYRY